MRRRLSPIDYENIITYTEAHGRGSVKDAAKAFGVSPTLVANVRSIYRAIMNDRPIPKSCYSYKSCIELVKFMKIKKHCKIYLESDDLSDSKGHFDTTSNTETSFIEAYIFEEEKKIIALEEELTKHRNNIKIAQEFAALVQ